MIDQLKVTLIASTPNIEQIVYTAARTCYSNDSIEKILDKASTVSTNDKRNKLIQSVRASGHESVFEHIVFTFGIDNISRAATHQLVRHRMASYSQKSQRYCGEDDFSYIVPPSVTKDYPKLEGSAKEIFDKTIYDISMAYQNLIARGIPKEDARYLLPNACTSNIVVTMNARELFHFFELRCCQRAQWEIRETAQKMLNICKEISPLLFEGCGPFCVQHGYCKEGERSCGAYPSFDKFISNKQEEKQHE